MQLKEYSQYDAMGLAELVRAEQVTPLELLEMAKKQSKLWNAELNAIVHFMWEEAEKQIENSPRGPLYGVPFLLKDIGLAYKGQPTTGSIKPLENYRPNYDSDLWKLYRNAGLIAFGKTNVPEFGLKGITDADMRGVCHNPWNKNHTPGGSSGGAAAAVAAGIVPLAHGSDGGGSIRIPSSCCGLVGLKPSRGRIPRGPMPEHGWMGFVTDHVITKSVRDSALMMDLTGQSIVADKKREASYLELIKKKPKKLKVAYTTKSLYGKHTDSECISALEKSIELLREQGHDVCEAIFDADLLELKRSYMKIVASSLAGEFRRIPEVIGRKLKPSDVEIGSWTMYLIGESLSAVDLEEAIFACRKAERTIEKFLSEYDVFMTPTLSHPPTQIGELDYNFKDVSLMSFLKTFPVKSLLMKALDQVVEESFEKIPNTEIFNQSGHPAISLPLYVGKNNLPIGTQLVAGNGREDLLLQLAASLEESFIHI